MAKSPVPLDSPWMTRKHVADYLHIDILTVDAMARDGRLKKHRLGAGVVRYHIDEIKAALGPVNA